MDEILWMIEPTRFEQLASRWRAAGAGVPASFVDRREIMQRVGSVAVIDVRGPMMKSPPGFMQAASTREIRAKLREAAGDDSVSGVMLRIESPGGTVSGTPELAADVAAVRQVKPVHAYIEDLGASAAYWVASQAERITATSTAIIGSIGVVMIVPDLSKAFEDLGVKFHRVASSPLKGAGHFGTKIEDAHLERWQAEVDEVNRQFVEGVAAGRGEKIGDLASVADGGTFVAPQALEAGLIDEIQSFEQALAAMQAAPGGRRAPSQSIQTGGLPMEFTTQQIAAMRSLGLAEDATQAQATDFYKQLPAEKQQAVDAKASSNSAGDDGDGNDARPAAGDPAPPSQPSPDPVAVERNRCQVIDRLAEDNGLGEDWARRHRTQGTSEQEARRFAAELATMTETLAPVGRISGGVDHNLDTLGPALEDAIILRSGGTLHEEREGADGLMEAVRDERGRIQHRQPHERAREFRGGRFSEMLGRYFQAVGIDTSMMAPAQVCQLATNPRKLQSMVMAAGVGGHSTSDFDNILANALNKRLRAAYAELAPTWQTWCSVNANVPDFKEVPLNQLAAAPTPPVVREGAEYTYATVTDGKESYTLAKYGQLFLLTWEAMLNDDLRAFSRMPQMHGMAAARLEDDLAYAELTNNAALSDGTALFHADHGNLSASSDAISVASLGAARAAMRTQTGLSSEKLNIIPRVLIVPAAIETTAQQVINSRVDPSKSNAANNPFSGSMDIVAQPRLDDDSATAWYLAASPDQVDTVEVAFLAGQRQPVVEEEDSFSTDSRRYKVRHVVAAKAVDYRGLYKNPGA